VSPLLQPSRIAVIALVGALSACGGTDSQLPQHQEKLESLTATTTAIANAWLSGSVSPTYSRTAFEQTLLLVEQERRAVASSPGLLADRRGAALAQSADRLSRALAVMIRDVAAGDTASVRQHASAIGSGSPELR
jgi:hypothetical protein